MEQGGGAGALGAQDTAPRWVDIGQRRPTLSLPPHPFPPFTSRWGARALPFSLSYLHLSLARALSFSRICTHPCIVLPLNANLHKKKRVHKNLSLVLIKRSLFAPAPHISVGLPTGHRQNWYATSRSERGSRFRRGLSLPRLGG